MKGSTKSIDMCSGNLFVNILRFAIPFMLTGIFQRLYNAADVVVVGRYAGREALAGVGTTDSITTLILNLFLGLSVGVSVALGRAMGANDEEKERKIVHTAISMSVLCGAFVSVVGIVFAEPLLKLIDVPANVMPQAKIYMQIVFMGKIPSLIYNFGSAILRARGDTKRPFYIITISGIINVVLNLFFVICVGLAADGVALATVISQVFTAVCILFLLSREEGALKLNLKKLGIDKEAFGSIVRIGVPSGVQSMTFSVSNVLVQSSVNSFGAAAIAGSAAAASIGGFYYFVGNTLFQTSVSFVSHNVGAKSYKRINKIVLVCLLYGLIGWGIEVLISLLFGETLIGFYAPGDAEAIKWGLIRLSRAGCFYGLHSFMEIVSGALRGMGYSMQSMLASIVGVCGIRIIWILTAFRAVGTFKSLFLCFPLSWFGTFVIQGVIYIYAKKKLTQNESK